MKNTSILKNELIFEYAAGTCSLTKSIMASTYLYLNAKESSVNSQFENYLGEEFNKSKKIKPSYLTPEDCLKDEKIEKIQNKKENLNPILNIIRSMKDLDWKKIFNGFYESSVKISNKEFIKFIKMDPGAKVPLHSHNGKEYILVLDGKFSDEYGEYKKGDLQINDSNIKHTPIACKEKGCICLTLTEKEIIFYGPFAPLLNIFTLTKSFFKI